MTKWICHDCTFTCDTLEEALDHILGDREAWTHWIYEHLGISRFNRALREAHTSDAGGAYVTACNPEQEEERIRRERTQLSKGML